MKLSRTTVFWTIFIATAIESLFIFRFINFNFDHYYHVLMGVSIGVSVVALVALHLAFADKKLEDDPGALILFFFTSAIACMPTVGFIVDFTNDSLTWVMTTMASFGVNAIFAFAELGNAMGYMQSQSQPRH